MTSSELAMVFVTKGKKLLIFYEEISNISRDFCNELVRESKAEIVVHPLIINGKQYHIATPTWNFLLESPDGKYTFPKSLINRAFGYEIFKDATDRVFHERGILSMTPHCAIFLTLSNALSFFEDADFAANGIQDEMNAIAPIKTVPVRLGERMFTPITNGG